MTDLVCLQCGKEIEYDWAPCPHCGWKAPGPWESSDEEESLFPLQPGLLAKPYRWTRWIVWFLLIGVLAGLMGYFFRH